MSTSSRQLRSTNKQQKQGTLNALPFGLNPAGSDTPTSESNSAPLKVFPGLPIEIISNIVSHCKSTPSTYSANNYECLRTDYMERSRTLSALSQTCRALRVNSLPLLWQTLEVLECRIPGEDSDRALATELVRQCEIITIRQPDLAQYVRTVKISLPLFSFTTVFKELARSLQLLPNLQTVHILKLDQNRQNSLQHAFRKCCCPSVRTVVLPRAAYGILPAFPNVRDVEFTTLLRGFRGFYDSKFSIFEMLRFFSSKCRSLRNLRGFYCHVDLLRPTSAEISGLSLPSLQFLKLELHLSVRDGSSDVPLASPILRVDPILRDFQTRCPKLQKFEVILDYSYATYAADWHHFKEQILDKNRTALTDLARSVLSFGEDGKPSKLLTVVSKSDNTPPWEKMEHYRLEQDGTSTMIPCHQSWLDETQDCCLVPQA